MGNKTPFLSLTDATFRLGERLIFQNTSWTFEAGQHWGIAGPNGCGKSFFGEALLGHVPLVHGDITWHFKPPRGFSIDDCLGHIAFEDRKTFVHGHVLQSRWQSFEQDDAISVAEALSYERVMDVNPFEVTDRRRREKARFQQRQRRAIKLLGVEPLLDRKLMVLSNGETQKFHLARALSRPLRLLILDEPFTGLDVRSRAHFQQVLAALMSSDLRVIVITADPASLPKGITHLMHIQNFRVAGTEPLASKKKQRGPFATKPPERPKSGGMRRTPGASRISSASAAGEAFAVRGIPALSPRRRRPAATVPLPAPKAFGGARRSSSAFRANLPGSRSFAPSADSLRFGNISELVRMSNVTVSYGRQPVLRNINWTVRPGESWALLGPNGSGKTTLLSLITGDHPQAYSNDITVLGRKFGDGDSIWELKKKIGMVSPELHLHFPDSFTCLETVESGLRNTTGLYDEVSSRERRLALQWLARFDLRPFADTPLFELSAGQQRAALLARALVKSPALLILDEPCQGLDAAHRKFFLGLLECLINERRETVIYVTHDEREIPKSIHRVLRLGGAKLPTHLRAPVTHGISIRSKKLGIRRTQSRPSKDSQISNPQNLKS